MKRNIIIGLLLIFACTLTAAEIPVKAKWITADTEKANEPNTWIAYRKDIQLKNVPKKATTQIAVDSKYWLWINGEMVIFEGGLKRGPNPRDTYYDEIDLAPYLRKGNNKIAILAWYFGKEGFSHKDSGQSGLLFNMQLDKLTVGSDNSWLCKIHPAYTNTSDPKPNWRLPESNIRYLADKEMTGWQTKDCKVEFAFANAREIGTWGDAPWNNLVKRPIPFWKDFGIKTADFTKEPTEDGAVYTASLPYNMQMTPIIELADPKGGNLINIATDHLYGGSDTNLRAEYVTRTGNQSYESLGWLNGQQIIINCPKDVEITRIAYRETGYDTHPQGTFHCDNEFYMRFWDKALRTLYVNMRDTYFDCPDRERAQWWGDVVVLMGESFYTYSTSAHALMQKAIRELAGWQKEDGSLYSPVPSGNYFDELPAQMLASIGLYGFWNYYMNTGDQQTIADVYPNVKRYLDIWELDETGLTTYRAGGWSWGDWGDNIDIRLILAGWHYIALDGAAQMATLLGLPQDAAKHSALMEQVKKGFNQCWNGYAYRHPSYQKETDDRVQALAIISGIAGKAKYEQIYQLFQTQWHASPYMEKYVMEALFQMGKGKYALERIEKRFSPMVNNPDHTTLFEGWEIGGFGGGTTNHAWSGGALTVIGQYLCGISPLEAGYKVFRVEPYPGLFGETTISVPTVAGIIESGFSMENNELKLEISVPKATTAIVYLPETEKERIKVNGKLPGKGFALENSKYAKESKTALQLKEGKYSITVQYQ